MNKYIDIIKEKNPNLIIEKYNINNEGQNNDVVIVNNNFVFKFPKYPKGIKSLKIETNILNILKKYITLNIPNYEYIDFSSSEIGHIYAGYKMFRGIPLKQNIFFNTQKKETIAKQLATFLKELHSIPLEEVNNYEINIVENKMEWINLFEKIKENLFKFMKRESQELISKEFNNFFKRDFNFNKTLIHGDFGPSNIIFDPDNQEISGIIDFNEIAIGDPAIDIASLIGPFGYGEDFIKSFNPIYPNIEELIERAKFYASTFALQEALFGIEVGDKEAFDAGIKPYL